MTLAQCPLCLRVKRIPENPLGRKLICFCGNKFRPTDPLRKTEPVIQLPPPDPPNVVTTVSVLN